MNIPQIDQDLACIKAMYTQHINGYHISEKDLTELASALKRVNKLFYEISKGVQK